MDDNTEAQLAYEDAVIQIRDSVRLMKSEGHDFSSKGARTAFKKKLVDTMKKVASDKRIFQ